MKPKTKELIKNLTQTISKESKKVNGKNQKLIEILQKKLDKIKAQTYNSFIPIKFHSNSRISFFIFLTAFYRLAQINPQKQMRQLLAL